MKHIWKLLTSMSMLTALTVSSMASDLILDVDSVPEIEVASTISWSGLYGVGLLGYGWSNGNLEHQNVNTFGGPGGTYSHSGDDFIFGGAIGYNHQFDNNIVLGIEAGIRSASN